MGTTRRNEHLLRWYPEPWRRRYGAELLVLLEDTYGDRAVPWARRLELAWSGSAERLRAFGLVGSMGAPYEGVRAGSVTVLWAWAIFVVAGTGFQKLSEHWDAALPRSSTLLAGSAFDVVFWGAVSGACVLFIIGASCAIPFVGFLKSGGLATVRTYLLAVVGFTLASMAVLVPLALWAHHLSSRQRNGGSLAYTGLGLVEVVLVVATICSWTALSATVLRRMQLPARVMRRCGALSVLLAAIMAALLGGTAVWWAAMAWRAPRFLGGGIGSPATAVPENLIIVVVLMLFGFGMALLGARRVLTCLKGGFVNQP